MSDKAIDVAPALIKPILNAARTGAVHEEIDDHGAPKMIEKIQ